VLLPEPRREEMDLEGGMGIDALEHSDEVDVGLHALQTAKRRAAADLALLGISSTEGERRYANNSTQGNIAREFPIHLTLT
jgi:hypothetical protein